MTLADGQYKNYDAESRSLTTGQDTNIEVFV